MNEKESILTRIFKAEGNFKAALFWNTTCSDNGQYSGEKSLHSAELHSLFSCSCLADISDPIQFPLSQTNEQKESQWVCERDNRAKLFPHTKSTSKEKKHWHTMVTYGGKLAANTFLGFKAFFFKTQIQFVCCRHVNCNAYGLQCGAPRMTIGTFYDVCGIFSRARAGHAPRPWPVPEVDSIGGTA